MVFVRTDGIIWNIKRAYEKKEEMEKMSREDSPKCTETLCVTSQVFTLVWIEMENINEKILW